MGLEMLHKVVLAGAILSSTLQTSDVSVEATYGCHRHICDRAARFSIDVSCIVLNMPNSLHSALIAY
jgi:hypothetical protein